MSFGALTAVGGWRNVGGDFGSYPGANCSG